MVPEQEHDLLQRIFFQAQELESSKISAFLDSLCEGQPDLRSKIDKLLAADARCGILEEELIRSHEPVALVI